MTLPKLTKDDWKTIGPWAAVIVIFIGSPIYLAVRPNDFTPFVQVLLSLFLFVLAYWIGYKAEIAKAAKAANDRWLPQAESVIYRLLTLRTNVRGFSDSTKSSCSEATCDLPELDDPALKAVRIKMKSDCEGSSQRLDDIGHQLEDAISDWRRFIEANCHGEECARIWDAIRDREARLEQEIKERKEAKAKKALPPEDAL
ncbi:MAG: hypothetical protein BGO12_04525 [Verrucomicrobia bacterium 61-8]|nr:hypothetical protein [Verrucomicrobiota bacterium]OJV06734.1 MAG: hypothetical protein BGO12_04525 [Verrucomicrobia bacterium 61-8]